MTKRLHAATTTVLLLTGLALANTGLGATMRDSGPPPGADSAPARVPRPAARPEGAPRGESGWQVERVDQGDCVGRRTGPSVQTMVTFNHAGTLVLIAGRRDWKLPRGPRTISLSIDAHRWPHVQALSLQTMLMVLLTDPMMLAQLRTAQTVNWVLPTGQGVSVDVKGIGQVIDTLIRCRRQGS
jgi:hypothetical protein